MAKFLNVFLSGILAALAVFCWTYYATKLGATALISAALAFIAVSAVAKTANDVHFTSNKKIARQRKNAAETMADFFAFDGCERTLREAFEYLGYDVETKKNKLTVKNDVKEFDVALKFKFTPLNADDVLQVVQENRIDHQAKTYLFCKRYGADAQRCASIAPQKVILLDCTAIYDWLERLNKLPQISQTKKVKQHPMLSYALNKRRFGYYFGSALFLFATSFISYFPIYSLVWATLLTAIAFYSKFNTRFNVLTTDVDF